jgi:hypothetical protein
VIITPCISETETVVSASDYDECMMWETTIKCTVDVVCSFDRCAVTAGI